MILALLLFAQSAAPDGAALYKQYCSTPYCHGAAGTAARAPALAGRRFSPAHLHTAIADGIPSKGMPGFEKEVGGGGVAALVEYVRSLDAPAAPKKKAPIPALAGRDLFFDSSRLPSCSECHAAGENGSPIAVKLAGNTALPGEIGAPRVRTAQINGESPFVALIGPDIGQSARVYDLSSPLPVLRTVPLSQITLKSGATWNHRSVASRYSDAELASIMSFLLTFSNDIDNE